MESWQSFAAFAEESSRGFAPRVINPQQRAGGQMQDVTHAFFDAHSLRDFLYDLVHGAFRCTSIRRALAARGGRDCRGDGARGACRAPAFEKDGLDHVGFGSGFRGGRRFGSLYAVSLY